MTMISQTISLDSEQHAWLRSQPAGISGTLRLLTAEAMANASKKRKLTKADLTQRVDELRNEIVEKEAQLRDAATARLEAEQKATIAIAAAKSAEEREADRQRKWDEYRDTNPHEIVGKTLEELLALKAKVTGGGA